MENAATTVGSRLLGCLGDNRSEIKFLGDFERSSDRHDTNHDNNVNSSCTENGSESPLSSNVFSDFSKSITVAPGTSSVSSPKKSGRRSVQKRVVSIPIKEVEGSRLKGDSSGATNTPPSDSWAWRKYGQKPIKGSPYPRGYYRCSSSKGCPARKQVERSRSDPTMLVVTYTGDHNHPWPTSSRSNHHHVHKKPAKQQEDDDIEDDTAEVTRPHPDPEPEPLAIGFVGGLHSIGDELIGTWFGSGGHIDTTSSAVFPVKMMEEEDESLYADLGELPECSVVFRHGGVGPQVEIC